MTATGAGTPSSRVPSNSISHLAANGTDLWLGSGKGLALTPDGGRNFVSFRSVPQFARLGIFALGLRGDTVWTSTGYIKDVDGNSVQTGTGYSYSFDRGTTWQSSPQPLDGRFDTVVIYGINTMHFLPILVAEQNVTFDLALTDSTVWIASWSSGLRRSTDNGQTWKRTVLPPSNRNSVAPTDSLSFFHADTVDPRKDNNFLVFSVFAEDNRSIWAGSAGGVNKSTDGGLSWVKYTAANQSNPILANWVIAIKGQRLGTRDRIWTTNWPADAANELYGVSATDDSGKTWKNFLAGVKAYDFAFKDSIAYVATDQGLYRSGDGGNSWERSGFIVDPISRDIITTTIFYAVDVVADTVFGGTGDGLVRTIDNAGHLFGERWEILRTSQPLNSPATTYAYPNPFSPRQGPIRLHYTTGGTAAPVTIEVFDFGMNRVRTIIRDAQRSGSGEHDEIWDGRDEGGTSVPNGVYFYRLTIDGNSPAWGKVMVLQ